MCVGLCAHANSAVDSSPRPLWLKVGAVRNESSSLSGMWMKAIFFSSFFFFLPENHSCTRGDDAVRSCVTECGGFKTAARRAPQPHRVHTPSDGQVGAGTCCCARPGVFGRRSAPCPHADRAVEAADPLGEQRAHVQPAEHRHTVPVPGARPETHPADGDHQTRLQPIPASAGPQETRQDQVWGPAGRSQEPP